MALTGAQLARRPSPTPRRQGRVLAHRHTSAVRRGRTLADVTRAIAVVDATATTGRGLAVLRGLAQLELAEEVAPGRWALTVAAEREYGQALRDWDEGLRVAA
jgi:hypothetical protein